MNSKSCWLLVFYALFLPQKMAQDGSGEAKIQAYNLWLNKSSLGTVFSAVKSERKERFFVLTLKNRETFSNPQKLSLTIRYLRDEYARAGLSFEEQVFDTWQRLARVNSEKLKVVLICEDGSAFKVEYYMEDGVLKTETDFSFEREVGETPYQEVRIPALTDPNSCLVLNLSPEDAIKRLVPVLKDYFVLQNTIERYFKFEYLENQDGSLTIRVEGLKAVMTSKYHEQVELRFSWVPLPDKMTNLCYQLSGEYSSGIFRPGDFVDMKRDFIPELVSYHERIKELISQKLRQL